MKKRTVWTVGSAAVLAGAMVTAAICTRTVEAQTGKSVDFKQNFGQIFDQEPTLFYDVSGFGFGGPIHLRLAVYTNGLTSISSAGFEGQGAAEFTYVPMERVVQLRNDLVALGIESLQDNGFEIPDVPLKTVTFVRPTGLRGRANTYNYFLSAGTYADIEEVINDFMNETFPNFFNGDDGSGEM